MDEEVAVEAVVPPATIKKRRASIAVFEPADAVQRRFENLALTDGEPPMVMNEVRIAMNPDES